AGGGELLQRSLWGRGDRAGQDLAHRRVWGLLLFGAPAVEDDPSLARGLCSNFGDQARGADARRARDQDDASGAGGGAVQDEADVELLLVATHEAVARGDDRGDGSRHL